MGARSLISEDLGRRKTGSLGDEDRVTSKRAARNNFLQCSRWRPSGILTQRLCTKCPSTFPNAQSSRIWSPRMAVAFVSHALGAADGGHQSLVQKMAQWKGGGI